MSPAVIWRNYMLEVAEGLTPAPFATPTDLPDEVINSPGSFQPTGSPSPKKSKEPGPKPTEPEPTVQPTPTPTPPAPGNTPLITPSPNDTPEGRRKATDP